MSHLSRKVSGSEIWLGDRAKFHLPFISGKSWMVPRQLGLFAVIALMPLILPTVGLLGILDGIRRKPYPSPVLLTLKFYSRFWLFAGREPRRT